jgi:hypothetical protein
MTLLSLFEAPDTKTNPLMILSGLVFVGGVGAFLYANVVFTPEIVENAKNLRQEQRNIEISQLIDVVNGYLDAGKDLEELRVPLETALGGTKLEEYIVEIHRKKDQSTKATVKDDDSLAVFCEAENELAAILKANLKIDRT